MATIKSVKFTSPIVFNDRGGIESAPQYIHAEETIRDTRAGEVKTLRIGLAETKTGVLVDDPRLPDVYIIPSHRVEIITVSRDEPTQQKGGNK